MPSQPSIQAVPVAVNLTKTILEVEDTRFWQETSDGQFLPLELHGAQEVNLNASETKRGQLWEILLSFPRVLATQLGTGSTFHK